MLESTYREAPTMLKVYDEVQLTDQEKASALRDARAKKYWKLQDELKQQQKIEAYKEMRRMWTYQEQYDHASAEANRLAILGGKKQYDFDEFSKPIFHLLTQYFTNDPAFEKEGRSLSKGIMLMGNVGTGKTDLLKSFQVNKRMCFFVENCINIEALIRDNGLTYWKTFTGFCPTSINPHFFYQENIGWLFDDLGTEEVIKDYGNPLDAMDRIFHQRYLEKEKIPFYSAHLTTNLSAQKIEDRYGLRMRSRLREMYNVIELKGVDRRK